MKLPKVVSKNADVHSGDMVFAGTRVPVDTLIDYLKAGHSIDSFHARKLLRRLSGRERRFQKSINHRISRRIVSKARREGKGVRVEDLSGIRDRMRVRRSQRYPRHSWAFYQLRTFLRYKCALAGVPFETVDAAYTSRTCPECSHEEKGNRKSRSCFVCQACGHEANADVVGARNISFGGAVNRREVASEVGVGVLARELAATSPPSLGVGR